ncbi:MAG: outer membrane beta-barrel protein, partial [Kofleriaceae bacterium]
MRKTGFVWALMLAARVAAAEDVGVTASAPLAEDEPTAIGEVGLFGGGFISNYYHQFYDVSRFEGMSRPELHRLSPELGLRYAFSFTPMWSIEAEGSLITAMTAGSNADHGGSDRSAKLWNARAQAVFQLPTGGPLVPFAAVGVGLMHTSSDFLGSDTDFPIHAGGGVKFWISDTFAVRVDARYLRGPSEQAPRTLNAGYGEFSHGIS